MRSFVNEITDAENGGEGALSRWQVVPMCPSVSGLSRDEGEFVVARLSEIAREARVPLAGESCSPDLYIMVTPEPEALLREMGRRNRSYTFGYDISDVTPTLTSASLVEQFIKTARPVRVWYNLILRTPEGLPPGSCYGHPCNPFFSGSLLEHSLVPSFLTVFVVIDRGRLHSVTRGQLADYVAMVALAKLKPGAAPGASNTILRLFAGPPEAAPAGMTDWDHAYLHALYATEQELKTQRGLIWLDMLHSTGR